MFEKPYNTQDTEYQIKETKNFKELFEFLHHTKGIQGSQAYYSTEDLQTRITDVRASEHGEALLKLITGSCGLRDHIEKLYHAEKNALPKPGEQVTLTKMPHRLRKVRRVHYFKLFCCVKT